MIYSVNFMDMAAKINSLSFIKYLKETGWKQFKTKKTTVKVFQYEKEDIFEQVTIPIDKSLRDYNLAMYEAIKTISSIEKNCRASDVVSVKSKY
jgi:predicted RNA binding protein YcfA (HicA-like mRNA interferase family)